MPNAVPINDEVGSFNANLQVGMTVEDAEQKLRMLTGRSGVLVDKDNVVLGAAWALTEEGGPYIFRGTSVQDPTSTEDNARKRKQQRTFSTILLAGDYEEASRQLRDAARPYRGKEPDSPKTYCIPPDRFINSTWNEDEMRRQICERRDKIFPMLKDYVPTDRKQVVIGLRLGTGYGKTHVLTRFPQWLTAHAIYVTYNDNQNLNADQKAPEKALYIRLILALHGWSSKMCSHFMNGDECSPFWNLMCCSFALFLCTRP